MILKLAKKVFGTKTERDIKRLGPIIEQINSLEEKIKALSDDELAGQTPKLKARLEKGESLDDLLPEAFATVRETAWRLLKMRHFDVQLIGGMTLHQGRIAEMKTGEGKTLMATLPVYLNALSGKGVHVVTVNDYLATRDAQWMGQIYQFLGLSVGVVIPGLNQEERKQAYGSDVTYGTNNEFGFDYLRDNMKFGVEQMVQRPLNFAIVDEVDSILIDEARTPLIISGPAEQSTDKYYRINGIIPSLKNETDYTVDEKARTAILTEEGVAHVEKLLNVENLYDPQNIDTLHHVNQALKAHVLFKRDKDYVVKDGEVIIVDEFTGRLMTGRRWSDGLHQAVEAKEGVTVENENQTLATITFQNYFRMYEKLSGMTGTADTEAPEFAKIYDLDVLVIPTNKPLIRKDEADLIYKNELAKFKAVAEKISELHEKGQPVLVGTISIEKSEALSGMLKRRGLKHHVLNAKHHEKEAEIVAQAGRLGAVTISTNMAGRGTDIVLGGNPEFLARAKVGKDASEEDYQKALAEAQKICAEEKEKVLAAGGLFILGTERHESRRIDNQLRGRSGRQGDPGQSQFFIGLDDDLMRIFGSDRIARMMERLKMEEDEAIFHPWITKAIENAQKKVEAHNFSIRKNVLEFDDVMNKQRHTVYSLRRRLLTGENLKEEVLDLIDGQADIISQTYGPRDRGEFDWQPLFDRVRQVFDLQLKPEDFQGEPNVDALGEWVYHQAVEAFEKREEQFGKELSEHVEKVILLSTLDQLWKDHLLSMDHLREGIGLKGYAQQDPILAYKKEGYGLFQKMMESFGEDCLQKLFRVEVQEEASLGESRRLSVPVQESHGQSSAFGRRVRQGGSSGLPGIPANQGAPLPPTGSVRRETPKVGRNDPCPCGSGKKYKKCHGA